MSAGKTDQLLSHSRLPLMRWHRCVGTMTTGWKTEGSEFDSGRIKNFHFSISSISVTGPIQPPIKWVSVDFYHLLRIDGFRVVSAADPYGRILGFVFILCFVLHNTWKEAINNLLGTRTLEEYIAIYYMWKLIYFFLRTFFVNWFNYNKKLAALTEISVDPSLFKRIWKKEGYRMLGSKLDLSGPVDSNGVCEHCNEFSCSIKGIGFLNIWGIINLCKHSTSYSYLLNKNTSAVNWDWKSK
jgi:hypothetical protein